MFDYTVSRVNSPMIFKDVCRRIAAAHPEFIAQRMLIDIDGSTMQVFMKNGVGINICDDYDVGVVYALLPYPNGDIVRMQCAYVTSEEIKAAKKILCSN